VSAGAGRSRRSEELVLFSEAEDVILSAWLEEEETRTSGVNHEAVNRALAELGMPEEGYDDLLGRLEVAVARILLENDEHRLPNWWCTEEDGTAVSGRRLRTPEEKPERKVAPHSLHILTINLADSGPGFSWPEEYRLVWVPGYERFVVTIADDSGLTPGCSDAALAVFEHEPYGLIDKIGEALKFRWSFIASFGQGEWACCFGEGLVSEAQALAWRAEVWPDSTEGGA